MIERAIQQQSEPDEKDWLQLVQIQPEHVVEGLLVMSIIENRVGVMTGELNADLGAKLDFVGGTLSAPKYKVRFARDNDRIDSARSVNELITAIQNSGGFTDRDTWEYLTGLKAIVGPDDEEEVSRAITQL